MGTCGLSVRMKLQGREADHSLSYSAEVKKGGAVYSSILLTYLQGIVFSCLGKLFLFSMQWIQEADSNLLPELCVLEIQFAYS
jgi:hypothetical protein